MTEIMSFSFRSVFLVVLLLGLGFATSTAQPMAPEGMDATLAESSEALSAAATSSVVAFDKSETVNAPAVSAEELGQFVTPDAVGTDMTMENASFHLTSMSDRPQEMSGVSTTRKVMYVVGGALVVGGAVFGILALSGDDGGTTIPAPPNRP